MYLSYQSFDLTYYGPEVIRETYSNKVIWLFLIFWAKNRDRNNFLNFFYFMLASSTNVV